MAVNPAIKEFYDAQNNFHTDMQLVVNHVEDVLMPYAKDSPLIKNQLENYIAPYKGLTENPFGRVKDTEEDCLKEINGVLQDKFAGMQKDYITAARNLPQFQEFLKNSFPPEMIKMKDRRGSISPLTSEIVKPIQHASRYELVVREINKKNRSGELLLNTAIGVSKSINNALKAVTVNQSNEITPAQMKKYRDESRSLKPKTPLRAASIFPEKKDPLREMKRDEKLLQEQMQYEMKKNKPAR